MTGLRGVRYSGVVAPPELKPYRGCAAVFPRCRVGNLFGGDHVQMSQQVSNHSGLDIHRAEKALLFLAPLVMAQLQRKQQEAGAGAVAAAPSASAATAGAPSQGQPLGPQAAEQQSSLGGVIDAVEKMLHRNQ